MSHPAENVYGCYGSADSFRETHKDSVVQITFDEYMHLLDIIKEYAKNKESTLKEIVELKYEMEALWLHVNKLEYRGTSVYASLLTQ